MSVRKRGKVWVAVVYDRQQRKNVWVSGGPWATKSEARAAEAKALARGRRGRSAETVDQFAARWITDYPRHKDSTNEHYESQVKGFAKRFAGRRLDDPSAGEIEQWALAHPGQAKVVRTMFADAVRARLVEDNPFRGMRLNIPSKGRRDIAPPTEDEVAKLAEVAFDRYGPNFHAFVMCAAYLGPRPGELLALEWDRIDFKEDVVVVDSQYTRKGGTTSTKTDRARTIALLDQAKDSLVSLPVGEGPVFEALSGQRLGHASLNQYWQRTRKDANLEHVVLYQLRHHCATFMLNTLELAPQDVAAQLGHTDGGALILKLYGHPSESLARTRIKRANDLRLAAQRGETAALRVVEGDSA